MCTEDRPLVAMPVRHPRKLLASEPEKVGHDGAHDKPRRPGNRGPDDAGASSRIDEQKQGMTWMVLNRPATMMTGIIGMMEPDR